MTDVRWEVRPPFSPFGIPAPVGHVLAPDKATAERRARACFGPGHVVQAALSIEAERRERSLPAPRERVRLPACVKPAHRPRGTTGTRPKSQTKPDDHQEHDG